MTYGGNTADGARLSGPVAEGWRSNFVFSCFSMSWCFYRRLQSPMTEMVLIMRSIHGHKLFKRLLCKLRFPKERSQGRWHAISKARLSRQVSRASLQFWRWVILKKLSFGLGVVPASIKYMLLVVAGILFVGILCFGYERASFFEDQSVDWCIGPILCRVNSTIQWSLMTAFGV